MLGTDALALRPKGRTTMDPDRDAVAFALIMTVGGVVFWIFHRRFYVAASRASGHEPSADEIVRKSRWTLTFPVACFVIAALTLLR